MMTDEMKKYSQYHKSDVKNNLKIYQLKKRKKYFLNQQFSIIFIE